MANISHYEYNHDRPHFLHKTKQWVEKYAKENCLTKKLPENWTLYTSGQIPKSARTDDTPFPPSISLSNLHVPPVSTSLPPPATPLSLFLLISSLPPTILILSDFTSPVPSFLPYMSHQSLSQSLTPPFPPLIFIPPSFTPTPHPLPVSRFNLSPLPLPSSSHAIATHYTFPPYHAPTLHALLPSNAPIISTISPRLPLSSPSCGELNYKCVCVW